jgi:predicted acetyltransferase
MPWTSAVPPRPPSRPVDLRPATRSDRAVLTNLGQLLRHDLSESYGLPPNDDAFNDRAVDLFLAGTNPDRRAWLITVAGRTGGYVMTVPDAEGTTTIAAFFVVRGLRRAGVGRIAAVRTVKTLPGRWRIGFQRYNPGAEQFWSSIATFITFTTPHPSPASQPPPFP